MPAFQMTFLYDMELAQLTNISIQKIQGTRKTLQIKK